MSENLLNEVNSNLIKIENNERKINQTQTNKEATLSVISNFDHERDTLLKNPNNTKLNVTIVENKFEENIVDFLLEKVGFNLEHFKIILLLILYITGEGFVMIGISLIVPVISNPWKLSELEKGFIGGSVFLGFTFGAISAGAISDNKGRKFAFIIGNFFSLIGGILGIFAMHPKNFIFSNFLIGIGIGISIPSILTLCSEVTNSKIRSIIIGSIWIFFAVGEILGCILALKYEMHFYENGNWRKLLFFRCLSVRNKF
jgi:fucose permease